MNAFGHPVVKYVPVVVVIFLGAIYTCWLYQIESSQKLIPVSREKIPRAHAHKQDVRLDDTLHQYMDDRNEVYQERYKHEESEPITDSDNPFIRGDLKVARADIVLRDIASSQAPVVLATVTVGNTEAPVLSEDTGVEVEPPVPEHSNMSEDNVVRGENSTTEGPINRKDGTLGTATANEGPSIDAWRNRTTCSKLPDALIIGFEKCGTMTLKQFLNVHPYIFAEQEQNDRIFNLDETRSLEQYKADIPCTPLGMLKVEKMAVDGVPEKVFHYNPNIKLLVIVRDPVVRSISQYVHRVAAGMEERGTFATVVKRLISQPGGEQHPILGYGLYYKKLQPWLRYFNLSQIHVVNGDTYIHNPARELQKVEQFLGLRPFITRDLFIYSREKKFFCIQGRGEVECMNRRKGRPHPVIAPQIVQLLRDYYEGPNRAFFQMFGNYSWSGPIPQ